MTGIRDKNNQLYLRGNNGNNLLAAFTQFSDDIVSRGSCMSILSQAMSDECHHVRVRNGTDKLLSISHFREFSLNTSLLGELRN